MSVCMYGLIDWFVVGDVCVYVYREEHASECQALISEGRESECEREKRESFFGGRGSNAGTV